MFRVSLVIVAGCLALSCAHQPRKYVVQSTTEDPTLPEDPAALLTLSDRSAADGPAGPDLDRSLAAADRILVGNPRHGEAAWRAARALYLQTYGATEGLGEVTARCMDVSAVATAYSKRAEAHYYAALCMGARAQARQIEGLDLVPRMEKAGKAALARDPAAVHGGPHRLLGGVYLWAPAWPASVGDIDLALEHFEAAVELAPQWAENHMLLAYALFEDEQYEEATEALDQAKKLLDQPTAAGWRPHWLKKISALEAKLAEQDE